MVLVRIVIFPKDNSLHFFVLAEEESRIIGGKRAKPGEYPYQISIQVKPSTYIATLFYSPSGWAHNCGGSIVSKRHVVTAAHCLVGWNTTNLSIWAGTTELSRGGTRYAASNILVHPGYIPVNMSDIGIITIDTPFNYSSNVSVIIKYY